MDLGRRSAGTPAPRDRHVVRYRALRLGAHRGVVSKTSYKRSRTSADGLGGQQGVGRAAPCVGACVPAAPIGRRPLPSGQR
jgi:hypothetical protein